MNRVIVLVACCLLLTVNSFAQTPELNVSVAVQGLFNPVGLTELPNGNILIAEEGTGNRDLSAGISLLEPDGDVGRLISGFPSNRDSGDLSGVPLVGVSPDDQTIYMGNFNAGHLWTLPADLAQALPEKAYTLDDLGIAMSPNNAVQIYNPFDITFDAQGTPVITDSTTNSVAMENDEGLVNFIHRFQKMPNPENPDTQIDPVPTGITRVGDEYYVTLLGGCPFPDGSGRLVAIDGQGNERIILDSLNLPIDVTIDKNGTVWILEFAKFTNDGYSACFTGQGYLPNTGRLSRLNADNTLDVVVDNLSFPGAMVLTDADDFYISETFEGRIIKASPDDIVEQENPIPTITLDEPNYAQIDDVDEALQTVIAQHNLQANPGEPSREPESELTRLGHDLFFDPVLSGDQNISCATCHHPAFAMGDGRILPIGTGGEGLGEGRSYLPHVMLSDDYRGRTEIGEIPNPFIGTLIPRNSPTVVNSALFPTLFWDGRVENYGEGLRIKSLDETLNDLELTDVLAAQALLPITSVTEMSGATLGGERAPYIRRAIANRLMNIPDYMQRFEAVFETDTITPVHIAQAIAAFERQLIFTNAPWDAYIDGDVDALSDEQKRGALLFYGERNPDVNCASCHSGDLLSDFDFHNILAPQLGPGKGNGESNREDWGRANVTFDYRDQYKFRTPSLRNVTLNAPYLHDGSYPTLESVIRHHSNIWAGASEYDPSANLLPAYFSSVLPFTGQSAHSVAEDLKDGLPLNDADIADLVAFLEALTDPEAEDLSGFLVDTVPSGLALDVVPENLAIHATPAPAIEQMDTTTDEDEPASWNFENVASQVGLDFQHGAFVNDVYSDPIAMMGGGLCWIDYDADGWLDLYVVNSYAEDEMEDLIAQDALPTNQLYRNVGGTFENVSLGSGTDLTMRGNGCIVADFNNDDLPDIHITADGPNALLWNMGDGTFVDGAIDAGIASPEWNTAAATIDLNGDGWLDLFVGSYIDLDNEVPNPIGAFPQDYYGIPDRLYLNNGITESGSVTFREVTQDVGITIEERALGAIFDDFDKDGDPDLYIANDGQPNRLYEYQPLSDDPLDIGFRLIDTYETSGVNDRGSGMGVASGDWTGDGYPDLVVTNWDVELNAIYRNQFTESGQLEFAYSTYRIGMAGFGNSMTGWGVHFADFDLDTDLDMMTVNGRVPVTNFDVDAEYVRLYGNRLVEGHPGQFREWTQLVGLRDNGTLMARGSAVADFDNDGDLDVAINSIGQPLTLLQNNRTQGNWLMVDLGGIEPGTQIDLTLADGTVLHRTVFAGSSYLASEDPRVHFGVGDASEVVAIDITRLHGETQRLDAVAVNQIISAP
jgi:cytochrome c peroxidase